MFGHGFGFLHNETGNISVRVRKNGRVQFKIYVYVAAPFDYGITGACCTFRVGKTVAVKRDDVCITVCSVSDDETNYNGREILGFIFVREFYRNQTVVCDLLGKHHHGFAFCAREKSVGDSVILMQLRNFSAVHFQPGLSAVHIEYDVSRRLFVY